MKRQNVIFFIEFTARFISIYIYIEHYQFNNQTTITQQGVPVRLQVTKNSTKET